MDPTTFREFAKATVDYIVDYFETIRERPVLPSVEPGYLNTILPEEAPLKGECWRTILKDVEKIITPGLTHWHSPNFHSYYPTANSYPGIVGELLLSGLGNVTTDWQSNPASVELEIKMMDWLGQLIGLPEHFLNCSNSLGGGVIQNSASESTFISLISAKRKKVAEILMNNSYYTSEEIERKLVAYTSKQSNSSIEKSGILASIPMKLLQTDKGNNLRGSTLLEAIRLNVLQDLIPCCVIATLGTTGTCAFDNLTEIGPICKKYNIWLHVDAAYAGSAFACPEYRHYMAGIEFVDSFNINPHKWMLVNSDCSAMWFKNTKFVENALKVKPSTFAENLPQIQHWQMPEARRFRALKLWFVLRIYGIDGIRKHIRYQIYLANYFKQLVEKDVRFEVCAGNMGLICFRLKGHDDLTQRVLDRVTERKKIFIMPYYCQSKLVIRFVICSRFTTENDVLYAWNEIQEQANTIVC